MTHLWIRCSCTVIAFGTLAGCAHTRVTAFDPADHPEPRTPASQIRFYGSTRPKCPYVELGRIAAESEPFVSWDRVVKAARNAARDLGGDAVIGVQDSERISGATISPAGVSVEEKSSLSGVVIRFKYVECMD